jgi:UDP-N-acetylmuramate dehydrogenase
MINRHKNFSLKKLNTFGIDAIALEYINLESEADLSEYLGEGVPEERLILGEGSNLLFRNDYKGTVIHPDIKGVETLFEDELFIEIKAACGENWDEFVEFCCNNNYGGLENLSLIPGTVGSAPVQNIGAYGVEVKDRVLWVEGIEIQSGETKKIYNKDCQFEYRNSIFKKELKSQFIIHSVAFRLDKNPHFILNYGNLENTFSSRTTRDIKTLRECIIEIRESKLPDPKETGNAGSFFKNPVVSLKQFAELKEKYPEIPSYPAGEKTKIPAAWLIEKSGWKGVREKNTGTWPKQPLVIVNYGNASGEEIFHFSEKIRAAVRDLFQIDLEREVNVIG